MDLKGIDGDGGQARCELELQVGAMYADVRQDEIADAFYGGVEIRTLAACRLRLGEAAQAAQDLARAYRLPGNLAHRSAYVLEVGTRAAEEPVASLRVVRDRSQRLIELVRDTGAISPIVASRDTCSIRPCMIPAPRPSESRSGTVSRAACGTVDAGSVGPVARVMRGIMVLKLKYRSIPCGQGMCNLMQPCLKKNSTCLCPSPSVSKARREARCFRCSNCLVGAGEYTGAARNCTPLAGGRRPAHRLDPARGHAAHFAPGVPEKAEGPRGGNPWVELAERPDRKSVV